MAYAEVVVSSQATSESLPISVLDLMPSRAGEPASSAAQVIAANTDAAAQRLFTAPQQRFLRLIRGESLELLPPVDSMEPLWSDLEKAAVENRLGAAILGSDAT